RLAVGARSGHRTIVPAVPGRVRKKDATNGWVKRCGWAIHVRSVAAGGPISGWGADLDGLREQRRGTIRGARAGGLAHAFRRSAPVLAESGSGTVACSW